MTPFSSKGWRVVALVVRMAVGVLFVVSAVAKLADIDRFEIYIFTFNLLPLTWCMLAARVVVVAELLVGIGLLSNVAKRVVDCCALLMVVCFTVFLCYAALIGRTDSCQCFGSVVELRPLQSLVKNAVLILALVVAMGARPWPWRPKWFVWLPVVLACVATVFVRSAPDNWLFRPSEELYNAEELSAAISPEGVLAPLRLSEGRHAVAFLSPGCQFCRMADEKLTHICRRNDLDSAAFVYLVPSSDSTVAPLAVDTTSFVRPGLLVPPMTFALITYGQRPMLMLIDNGEVVATCHYRNIDEKQIVQFLR